MPQEETPRPPICQTCGGSGQISYFQGVSRFLLTAEECPECAGLGVAPPEPAPQVGPGDTDDGRC